VFVSDLHGSRTRYAVLFDLLRAERPAAAFLGGDLLPALPGEGGRGVDEFLRDILAGGFERLRADLGETYPRVFLILGNDDLASEEPEVEAAASAGLWDYVHGRRAVFGEHPVYGYACIPPSPFLLKDWERYDVSHYVDPGSVAPDEGWHTRSVSAADRLATIKDDLDRLVGSDDLGQAILLLHVPPYRSNLDRAALDGRRVDHVPLDVNIGSIAVRRLIEARQPRLTLHGHVHESARLTGSWRDRIGRTLCLSAAHDGPELAVVRFDPACPEAATRALL
jgi:Icc-related predicted phosphoesterase